MRTNLYTVQSFLTQMDYNIRKTVSRKNNRFIIRYCKKLIDEFLDDFREYKEDMSILLVAKEQEINRLRKRVYDLQELNRSLAE